MYRLAAVMTMALVAVGCQGTPKQGSSGGESKPAEPPKTDTTKSVTGAGDKAEGAPMEEVAATPEGSESDVRPPTAEDLEGYIKDLEGDGPLMAEFKTSNGTFNCELFEKDSPMTVANFVGLARGLKPFKNPNNNKVEKRPFYDGIVFHRVIPNFMIQTGDPLGVGRGGPGYKFSDEFNDKRIHDKPGTLSMANAGPGTNGSQLFITERPTPHLDRQRPRRGHTVFGLCKEVDVIKAIARAPKDPNDRSQSRPATPITIEKLTISRATK